MKFYALFLPVSLAVLAFSSAGACAAGSKAKAEKPAEDPAPSSSWYPSYGPYAPYPPGGWWGGQNQQPAEEEKKPTQIFQYDSKYRAAFEHPSIFTYGPQGDTRFEHGSTDPVTSVSGVAGPSSGAAMPPSGGGSGSSGMLPEVTRIPETIDVSLAPGRVDPEKNVTLRLRAPLEYSGGCWTVGPLEVDREVQGSAMIVSVRGFRINPAARTGQSCNPLSRHAVADIPLGREEIKAIKTIRFKLGTRTDEYSLNLENDSVVLTPVSMTSFKPFSSGSGADSLRQAFIAGNLVALFVPATHAGEDLANAIEDFARSRGLVPYGDPGAEDLAPVMYGNKVYYFLDTKRVVSSKAGRGDPRPVGTILRKRTVREVPGFPGGVAERLDVYAAVP